MVEYCHLNNVLFPGKEWQSHSKGGSKGILDLMLSECSTLIAALSDTFKDRLYFKQPSSTSKGESHQILLLIRL